MRNTLRNIWYDYRSEVVFGLVLSALLVVCVFLPIFGLPSTFKAPAGAIGRMVINEDTTVVNLDVRFKPAGYFLQITTPYGFTNVQMRPNADSTVWRTTE